MTSQTLLSPEERNWLIDRYLTSNETDHYCYAEEDYENIELLLKQMPDCELMEEVFENVPSLRPELELIYHTSY